MALSTTSTNNKEIVWTSDFIKEYIRTSQFASFMGGAGANNSVIFTKSEMNKVAGEQINIPLVGRLTGAGVGTGTLQGNEESITSHGFRITPTWRRNAVAVGRDQAKLSRIKLLDLGRPLLMDWEKEEIRDDIVTALGSINGVAYGTASAGQKNTWNADNVDRVLYGDAVGNYNATHATALLAVTAAMTLSQGIISLAKRLAKIADTHIKPMKTKDGDSKEFYVLFVPSFAMRDLRASLETLNSEAFSTSGFDKNPIFQGGDLMIDGTIVREVPEIATIAGVGAVGIDVAPCYLCGNGAVGIAWGQMPRPTTRSDTDYDFIKGVGIEELVGVEKITAALHGANAKDNGVFTLFVSGVADA
ncbi:MAG: hypothetical protein COA78_21950 [Blastopirellula sp.]|nr:MAG: hypothetical protein COA78_21950 [Blastopirellula sp.]